MPRRLLFLLSLFALSWGKKGRIDLQWSICDSDPQTVLKKLGQDDSREPYKDNPVTYYDTSPPSYIWDGLMFRTKTRRGEELSAVKAHLDPGSLGTSEDLFWIGKDTSMCVWDRYGNDKFFTCQVQSILEGRSELWSDEQIRFAKSCRRRDVTWRDLVAFGPHPNPKWRLEVVGHEAVFDDVQAGPLHLMELEVKVPKTRGDEIYQEISTYLGERGVRLCRKQEPRTLRLFHGLGYTQGYRQLVKQFN